MIKSGQNNLIELFEDKGYNFTESKLTMKKVVPRSKLKIKLQTEILFTKRKFSIDIYGTDKYGHEELICYKCTKNNLTKEKIQELENELLNKIIEYNEQCNDYEETDND